MNLTDSPAAPRAPKIDLFLMPGEYVVGDAAHRVRTLLGSCVSVTLWHPGLRVGAMSHFLLPARERGQQGAPDPRYGEDAFQLMLRDLAARGAAPAQCQAKVFGGGSMFRSAGAAAGIGRQNGELALRLLQQHRIALVSESLYGSGHRRICFDVASGAVWSHHATPGPTPPLPSTPPFPPLSVQSAPLPRGHAGQLLAA